MVVQCKYEVMPLALIWSEIPKDQKFKHAKQQARIPEIPEKDEGSIEIQGNPC